MIRIKGAKEIVRDLRELSRKADDRLQDTLMEAAEIGREEIARRAPKNSGRLSASITVEKEGQRSVKIIPKRTYYYAGVHEFGGVHHARGGGYMQWTGQDRWIFARRVRIPARPYFYPGFDAVESRILEKIENDITNWIDRTV